MTSSTEQLPSLHRTVGTDSDALLREIGLTLLDRFGAHVDYTIAGSFAAATLAYQCFDTDVLLYNDIDVFVSVSQLPGYKRNDDFILDQYPFLQQMILDVQWIDGAVSSFPITLNIVVVDATYKLDAKHPNNLDLRKLVGDFDVNAVQAAFNVKFCHDAKKWEIPSDGGVCSKHFRLFMRKKILEIPHIDNIRNPGKSIIRLAYKAWQMGLAMKLPPPEDIIHYMRKSTFSEAEIEKWDSLSWSIVQLPGFRNLYYRRLNGSNPKYSPRFVFDVDLVTISFSLGSADSADAESL